jgi:hypothetical protein
MASNSFERHDSIAVKYERITRQSDKAILVEHIDENTGETKEIWWPKSQIEIDEISSELIVKGWLVNDKSEEQDIYFDASPA